MPAGLNRRLFAGPTGMRRPDHGFAPGTGELALLRGGVFAGGTGLGTNMDVIVPQWERWRLLSMQIEVQTDGNVGTRQFRVAAGGGAIFGGNLFVMGANVGQTEGLTWRYQCYPGLPLQGLLTDAINVPVPIPPLLYLERRMNISTAIGNIQATDRVQWEIYYEFWDLVPGGGSE